MKQARDVHGAIFDGNFIMVIGGASGSFEEFSENRKNFHVFDLVSRRKFSRFLKSCQIELKLGIWGNFESVISKIDTKK